MGRRKLMEIEIPRVAAPLPPEMPAEAKTIFVPVPTEPETPDEVQDEKDVNKFFQAFGVEGGRVRVYRVDPNTGQLVFMATCTVDVISEEFLQVQFGGGKYEVRLFDSKAKYVTSKRMNIGAISGGPDNTPKPSIFVTLGWIMVTGSRSGSSNTPDTSLSSSAKTLISAPPIFPACSRK